MDAPSMREFWEEFFNLPYTDIVMGPRTVEIAESGELAYDFGSWTVVFDEESEPSEAAGKSTIVWRKQDGEWKCAVMTFSMDGASG